MSKTFSVGGLPSIYKPRVAFPMSYDVKTMFNMGKLVPIYLQEVLPGDTFKLKDSFVIRTSSPFIKVPMDNLFADVYYFFVPNRIICEQWTKLMGENTASSWVPSTPAIMPTITGTVSKNTIADYLGIAPGTYTQDFNSLPIKAYAQIWNDWFRNENTEYPVYISKSSDTLTFNNNVWSATNICGGLAPVNKLNDLFTTCLPAPQKGAAVSIGFANGTNVPVDAGATAHSVNDYDLSYTSNGSDGILGISYNSVKDRYFLDVGNATYEDAGDVIFEGGEGPTKPDNFYANLSGVNITTVNDLRMAFAIQNMLEKDARGGTRYTEILANHFGVVSPDARLQRSELLGGTRIPLSLTQVTQTSKTDSTNKLADVASFSLSNGTAGFSKGFIEHGFVLGVMCVRQHHTYQNGIQKLWNRLTRYDYYDPCFAHIGEQPVYKTELYAGAADDAIFGYNEAWIQYKYNQSMITGSLRSSASEGFDIWHFADDYSSAPTLSAPWCNETTSYVDRCLSIPSTTAPQFILDCYHDMTAIRELPAYCTPGRIDH